MGGCELGDRISRVRCLARMEALWVWVWCKEEEEGMQRRCCQAMSWLPKAEAWRLVIG